MSGETLKSYTTHWLPERWQAVWTYSLLLSWKQNPSCCLWHSTKNWNMGERKPTWVNSRWGSVWVFSVT